MEMFNGRPGDRRNFVHKRIIGAAVGAIGGLFSGGPVGALGGAIGGFTKRRGPAPVTSTVIPGFAPDPGDCAPGFFRNRQGQCVPLRTPRDPGISGFVRRTLPGGDPGQVIFGEAVMGRFGAALEPGFRDTSTAVCPRGTVLGIDDLCYNKRDLKNSERKWPRGTRPLLTGGDMRCIRIAAAAANKLQAKQKQLREMGMLPAAPKARRRKALPSGHHAHVAHD